MNDSEARTGIADACRLAWQTGLMRGFSGNASSRLGDGCFVITASGAAKGRLAPKDLLIVDADGGILEGTGAPSLEAGLHLGIYRAFPAVQAILHTHPPYMQALELSLPQEDMPQAMLNLPMPESVYWRERLSFAPSLFPGSKELADAARDALAAAWPRPAEMLLPCAVWLSRHGLIAVAETIDSALGITEQFEHLAEVQIAALGCRH